VIKNNKIKIGIIGPGGIGGLLAVLLSNKNFDVVCSNGKIENKKISYTLKSKLFGNKKNIIKFTNKKLKFFDIIFICVKYQHLKSVIKKIDIKSNRVIIPLLNGLKHVDILKKIYGEKVIIANIGKTVSFKEKKDLIIHNSISQPVITMSSENKLNSKNLDFTKKILKKINLKVKIYNSDNLVIWTKLVRINALSAITALYNLNLGEIRKSQEKKNQLMSVLKETIRLAKCKGINLKYKDVIKEISKFPDNLTTSMQRDIADKKKSEIDTILGGIVDEAKKEKLILKTNKKVYKLLKNR
jgi:2-dehydropantoate 2-reductase